MLSHPLFRTLLRLKGNARYCVYTEPMWGIPFNLYAPYISIYMLSFGIKDSQVGLIASVGLFFQIFAAMVSGIITDKLGRKRTTFLFDFVSWSVPTFIWAIAQDFNYFLIAAIVNAAWRITSNSWTCLMVEDTDPELLVDIYSWIYISGLLSAFFAPIAGILVNQFTLVPAMRALFVFACLMMTAKFIVLNVFAHETKQGQVRMIETRHQSFFTLIKEYREVIGQIAKAPATLYTLGIMVIMGASQMISSTFWSIIVTRRLDIPEAHLPYYVSGRSVVMLLFFFLVMPAIREMKFRNPMLVGFAGFALSQVLLILAPAGSYFLLAISVILEACSIAALGTQVDRMLVVTVDPVERARIMAILYVVMILFTTPFGWIAGLLSEVNRALPFVLNLGLFAIGAVLTYLAAKAPPPAHQESPLPVPQA